MREQLQLYVLVTAVILVGCSAEEDRIPSNENEYYSNLDTGTGPAVGDDGSMNGSDTVIASPDASTVNPVDPGSTDAGSVPPGNGSGMGQDMDSGRNSTGIDSGTSTGYDGGQTTPIDAGITAPDGNVTPPQDAGNTGNGDDPYEEVRQVCVDTINEYRATLGLSPMNRASADLEQCSDEGAKKDGDSRIAHGSAGDCRPLGSQNTCPGYPVGGWGSATLADALKMCLAQMWDEGEPPEGREECLAEYFRGDTTCFMTYGHYLNMSDTSNGTVACGFYDMGNNTFWMNQNFGR